MFCDTFPDLVWLKKQAETRFSGGRDWNNNRLAHAGWPTVILNVKAGETYRDNIPGPLSFFTTLNGRSTVEVHGRTTNIPDHCFFLTNSTQRYTLQTTKKDAAETFNIHFGDQWAEGVLASFGKTESLIDDPHVLHANVAFHNKLYPKSDQLKNILTTLKVTKDQGALKRDELLYSLMTHLLDEQNLLRQRAKQLPALRTSTREEIARRLHLATDYIYAHSEKAITLDELASISCLSKFHFLRLFKQFHRATPHQFVTHLRIQRSQELIRTRRLEIKTIASELGFDSASTFARLFRQQVGMYPRQYQATLA